MISSRIYKKSIETHSTPSWSNSRCNYMVLYREEVCAMEQYAEHHPSIFNGGKKQSTWSHMLVSGCGAGRFRLGESRQTVRGYALYSAAIIAVPTPLTARCIPKVRG